MYRFNHIKNLIYVAVFLVGFALSSFASANTELSGHFGMKFGGELDLQEIHKPNTTFLNNDQKTGSYLHFGADALYRQMMGEGSSSFGLGVRYRFAFTGEKDFIGSANDSDKNDKYKFTHHRAAFLLNYRFNMDQLFVGVVVGLDVWKSLKFTAIEVHNLGDYYYTSNQFLWNQITGQVGLELGYKVTSNFLVKLEGGYDLSSFGDLKCKFKGNSADAETDCNDSNNYLKMTGAGDDAETEKLKLNGFYATLGIGWLFG